MANARPVPVLALVIALASLAIGGCGRTGLAVDRAPAGIDSGVLRDAIVDAWSARDATVLPPLPAPFLDIRVGRDHACALDEAGRVVCWGDNRQDELALGDAADSLVPVPVDLPTIVAIDVGPNLSCALDVDGAVWCWGGLPLIGGARVPTQVSGATPMQGASAGSLWACTLSRVGAIACFGARTLSEWREVVPRGARALAMGSNHGCALVGSDVLCFGSNGSGQLGIPVSYPSFGGEILTATVPGVREAVSIASGFGHSCAATADGSVYCWGSNHEGQLGFEPVGTDLRPTRIPGLDGVDTVEAGWGVSCALRRGELWCWGDGSLGQLGGGPAFPPQPPTRVHLVEPVRSVSAGVDFTCAIDGDGRPWCWGQNTRGQLGDGTREDRYYPVPVAL